MSKMADQNKCFLYKIELVVTIIIFYWSESVSVIGMGPFTIQTIGGEGNGETPVGECVQMWNRPDRHEQHKPRIKRNVVFHSVDERLMSRVSGR